MHAQSVQTSTLHSSSSNTDTRVTDGLRISSREKSGRGVPLAGFSSFYVLRQNLAGQGKAKPPCASADGERMHTTEFLALRQASAQYGPPPEHKRLCVYCVDESDSDVAELRVTLDIRRNCSVPKECTASD